MLHLTSNNNGGIVSTEFVDMAYVCFISYYLGICVCIMNRF